jgi:hypothetical protein
MKPRLPLTAMARSFAGLPLPAQDQVVRLHHGKAPGSESRTHAEKETASHLPSDRWIPLFADWLDGQGLLKGPLP